MIQCIHKDCWWFGTNDNPYPAIRQSTIENAMLKSKNQAKKPSKKSTKTKCYHISFLSKFKNDFEKLAIVLAKLEKGNEYEIRHVCGCGKCCNPNHLEIGTHVQNQLDKGIHFYLKKIAKKSIEDYDSLIKIFKRNEIDLI